MPDQDQRLPRAESPESLAARTIFHREETRGRSARPVLFVILFGSWIVFSGRFDLLHLSLGLISCGIVTVLSGDLIPELGTRGLLRTWLRFARYLPWLLGQIMLANLRILRLVFHPRMMERIDPHIVRFHTGLGSDIALVTLANAITLTPGTITVRLSLEGEFEVHAIDRPSGEALPGAMASRVARVFEED
jgi:multicomponent Na+:H+ antiporter subunit E